MSLDPENFELKLIVKEMDDNGAVIESEEELFRIDLWIVEGICPFVYTTTRRGGKNRPGDQSFPPYFCFDAS